MNASELHRKLIYCGYSDLSDYLRGGPLNRFLYQRLLDMKNRGELDNPILTIFNELYYQCTRVQFDSTPGDDIKHRYISDCERWLNSKRDACFVFTYVAVFFAAREDKTFAEECFYNQFRLLMTSELEQEINDVLWSLNNQGIHVPNTYEPIPAPIDEIPERLSSSSSFADSFINSMRTLIDSSALSNRDINPWQTVTNDFSRKTIENYVNIYRDRDSRLSLLSRIESACRAVHGHRHERFFDHLRLTLQADLGYEPGSLFYSEHDGNVFVIPEEEKTVEEVEEMYRKMFSDLAAKEMTHQKTIENLSSSFGEEILQLQEEKADLEMQLSRMEARHKADIDRLQSELEQARNERSLSDFQPETAVAPQAPQPSAIPIADMADYVKTRFSKQGADEFCGMYWHFITTGQRQLDKDLDILIDGIVPAVIQREAPHQTFEMPNVQQFNNNPQAVNNNHYNSEKTNNNGDKD